MVPLVLIRIYMGVQIQVWQEHSRRIKSLCMRAGEESIQSRSNCYFAMYLNLHSKKQCYWFRMNTCNPRTFKKKIDLCLHPLQTLLRSMRDLESCSYLIQNMALRMKLWLRFEIPYKLSGSVWNGYLPPFSERLQVRTPNFPKMRPNSIFTRVVN